MARFHAEGQKNRIMSEGRFKVSSKIEFCQKKLSRQRKPCRLRAEGEGAGFKVCKQRILRIGMKGA